jgi:cell division GTPase FtsZ
MRECKIGVGGCGGKLYNTFLEYAEDLIGPVLRHKSPLGCEEELVNRRDEEWKTLFEGLWLDLDSDDVKSLKPVEERGRNEDYNGGYYYLYKGKNVLPHDLENKMVRRIGYSMDAPGFIHRPELQMAAFAIPEVRDQVCKKIYEKIGDMKLIDSLFFFVGLGGGTGTGVIGPLTDYIRNKRRSPIPSFVLAALTGKKDGGIMTQSTFYRRNFNALWALSDLLAGKKVDCVILMDNDKISEIEEVKKERRKLKKEERKMDVLNRYTIKSIFPLLGRNELEQIDEADWQREMASNFKPILIPCYWHGKMKLKELIKNAIEEGKLADCDHKTADAAYVITKGFLADNKEIEGIVKEGLKEADVRANKVKVWRTGKTGGNPKDKEALILLRNPGIKELLPYRIEAAKTFIRLIQNNSDEGAIKKVREAAREFLHLKGQDLEDYVIEGKRGFVDDFRMELEEVKKRIENGEQEIFKENARIKLGYLFSMDARYSQELDQHFQKMSGVGVEFKKVAETRMLKNLKYIFKEKGSQLSEIVTVMKEKEDKWEITDEERKFIVRKEDGKLNVYNSVGSSIFSREEDGLSKERLLDLLKGDEDVKREIKTILNPITDLP